MSGEVREERVLDGANGIGQCKQMCESAYTELGFPCLALTWEDAYKTCRLYTGDRDGQITTTDDNNFKVVICEKGNLHSREQWTYGPAYYLLLSFEFLDFYLNSVVQLNFRAYASM